MTKEKTSTAAPEPKATEENTAPAAESAEPEAAKTPEAPKAPKSKTRRGIVIDEPNGATNGRE